MVAGIGILVIVVMSSVVYYITYGNMDTTFEDIDVPRNHPSLIQLAKEYLPIMIDKYQVSLDECESVNSKEGYSNYMTDLGVMINEIKETLPSVSQLMFNLKNGDYVQNSEIGPMLKKFIQLESEVGHCIDNL